MQQDFQRKGKRATGCARRCAGTAQRTHPARVQHSGAGGGRAGIGRGRPACMSSRSGRCQVPTVCRPAAAAGHHGQGHPRRDLRRHRHHRWLPPAWCGDIWADPSYSSILYTTSTNDDKTAVTQNIGPDHVRRGQPGASPCGCSPATASLDGVDTSSEEYQPSSTRPCTMHCPKLIPPMWCWPPR